MNILQNIFTDHYEEMIYLLHPRQAVVENVEKMIHCGDPSFGGAMYGCPVIATSRIDKYDGDLVTFHYNRHEDNKLIYETIPALEFMQRLIRHIPEKNFKIIRYYGIYARHRSSDRKLRRVILKEKHRILLSFNRWRDCLLSSFGYDPLKCPHCNSTMLFPELCFNHKRVSLDELYERAMAKHRGCRSPSGIISSCTVSSGCSKLSLKRRNSS